MDHYFDVIIRENKKMKRHVVMARVYESLHKRIVEIGAGKIAVSFPAFGNDLGDILRVHSSCNELILLNEIPWNIDHVNLCYQTNICIIPKVVKYRVFTNTRPRKCLSKLRSFQKYKMSRFQEEVTPDEILKYKKAMFDERLSDRFLHLRSSSTKLEYKKYIRISEVTDMVFGEFDSFGLSKVASVPVF